MNGYPERNCTCHLCSGWAIPFVTEGRPTVPPEGAATVPTAGGEGAHSPSPAAFSDDELDRIRALVDKHTGGGS